MKIVHIITGLEDGGAEAVLYRLCLNAGHHEHVVISLMTGGKYGPLLERANVPVYCLDMPQGSLRVRSLARLWRVLRHHRPDIVQTWMLHADLVGGLLARAAGVRRIFWNIRHCDLDARTSAGSSILASQLCAGLSRWVPYRVICCSQRAAAANKGLGYRADKFHVIPNGYDLNAFRPSQRGRKRLRDELGVGAETPLLGMVGRFDSDKDHKNLLSALGALSRRGVDFRCVLVGSGLEPSNDELLRLLDANELTGSTILLGRRDDVPSVMNALDLHVLSSAREAFPNVLCEAMSCGTPCVSTDVGDAALIIGDTGWVVPPRNPRALSEALKAALLAREDRELWRVRKQACRHRIEQNFCIERMVNAYDAAWQDHGGEARWSPRG